MVVAAARRGPATPARRGEQADQARCQRIDPRNRRRRDQAGRAIGRIRPAMGHGTNGTFGARLRALREAAGLTQEELAERAGLSVNGLSQLERGERRRPHPRTVRALAEALGLSEEERTTLLATLPNRYGSDRQTTPGHDAGQPPVPLSPLLGRERELEAVEAL